MAFIKNLGNGIIFVSKNGAFLIVLIILPGKVFGKYSVANVASNDFDTATLISDVLIKFNSLSFTNCSKFLFL